jgi:DNA-binding GntR family transcriptional regulator
LAYRNSRAGGVYPRLKRLILTARIMPGTALAERDLAAQLGVSRTPVREAIARLVAEGLVHRRTGRGHFVPRLGAREAGELYAVREALEVLAVRLALQRMTAADMRRLELEVETLARTSLGRDGTAGRRPGVRLHDLIVRASGNTTLYEAWQRILEKIIPYMWVETLYADNAAQTVDEHRALCRVMRARNPGAAENVLRRHIARARDNLVRVFTAQQGLSPGRMGAPSEDRPARKPRGRSAARPTQLTGVRANRGGEMTRGNR